MKKILGLDLGVASIGWAFIEEDEQQSRVLGMGVRIIPMSADERDEFSSGNAISKNAKRRIKRGMRRNIYRLEGASEASSAANGGITLEDKRWNNLPSAAIEEPKSIGQSLRVCEALCCG